MALNLVEGNTAQQVKAVLTRSDTNAVQDLTGASVAMYFKKKAEAVAFSLSQIHRTAQISPTAFAILRSVLLS